MSKGRSVKNLSNTLYILLSVAITVGTLLVLSMIAAVACNALNDPTRYTDTCAFITLLLTSFIASYLVSRLRGEGGVGAAVIAMAIFIVLRVIASLISGGVGLGDLLDCLCYIGVGVIAAFLGQKKGKRHHR